MSDKKKINVYYQGMKKTLSYFYKFDINQTKVLVKQIFKIKESIDQIYFQDDEGNLMILSENIPDDLSVHIYVEPDSIPKNPSKELNVMTNNLLKFNWILYFPDEMTFVNTSLNPIFDKYIYKPINDDESHPMVKSSVYFTSGKHFCVIRKGSKIGAYSCLIVCDDSYKGYMTKNENGTQIGLGINTDEISYDDEEDNFASNIGIFIDMKNKFCKFYNYDKKQALTSRYGKNYEGKITGNSVFIAGWIKRQASGYSGFTILNEGCIPIPKWVH